MEEEETEKERKPAHQAAAGVPGEYDKSSFGLGSFVQLGHNEIKPEAAFGVTVTALDGVAQAGILIHLALEFGV